MSLERIILAEKRRKLEASVAGISTAAIELAVPIIAESKDTAAQMWCGMLLDQYRIREGDAATEALMRRAKLPEGWKPPDL